MWLLCIYCIIISDGILLTTQENLVLNIGVIVDKHFHQGITPKENVSLPPDCNNDITVRLHWQTIDSKENFQLLRSLHQLQDQNHTMDLIILNDCKNILTNPPGHLHYNDTNILVSQAVFGSFCYINRVNKLGLLASSPKYCSQKQTSCSSSEYNKGITCNQEFENGPLSTKMISCIKSLKWTGLLIFYEDITGNDSGDVIILSSTIVCYRLIFHVLLLHWDLILSNLNLAVLMGITSNERSLSRSFIEEEIAEVVLTLSFEGSVVLSYQVNKELSDLEIVDILQTLDKPDTALKNITIVCSTWCISKILSMAGNYVESHRRTSAIRHRSQWLIFDLTDNLTRPWTEYVEMIDNVACVRLPLLTVNTDKTAQAVELLIREAMMMTSSNKTLARYRKSCLLSEIIYQLQTHNGNCQKYPVETLMWTKGGRSWSHVGYIDINGGILGHGKVFPNIDFGFNGRQMNVSTLEWFPFVKLVNGRYEGLCFDILNALSAIMNFTYHVENPPDKQWGTVDENGSWTGMIGQLARAEVDLVVTALSVQEQREMVMDFTHSYLFGHTAILLQRPNPLKNKWRAFMDPFSNELWICIILMLPVMSAFLFVLERFSPYYKDESNTGDKSDMHTYQDSFWYMYGALLTQGGEHLPRSSTGRILLSSWWLFSIMVMATYSGNLIASMTINKTSLPFTTIQGMINQDKYTWGTIGGSIWETVFKQSTLSEYQRIWQGIVKFNKTDQRVLSSSSNDHIRKVKEGNYAYIADKVHMDFKVSEDCSLKMADELLIPLHYSIGLPNNSPYTKLFSDEIIALHENGLLHNWKTKRWPQRNKCVEDTLTEAKAITLIDVQSAFYIVIIGTVLGCIVLLAERMSDVFKRRRSETVTLQQNNTTVTVPNELQRNNKNMTPMESSNL